MKFLLYIVKINLTYASSEGSKLFDCRSNIIH